MGGKAMRREILTLKEACEYMNCSRSTIYKYMENEDVYKRQGHTRFANYHALHCYKQCGVFLFLL